MGCDLVPSDTTGPTYFVEIVSLTGPLPPGVFPVPGTLPEVV